MRICSTMSGCCRKCTRALTSEPLDVVVGSRHVDGGDADAFTDDRAKKSELATRLSRMVVPETLLDPMSGFFMVRREAFEACMRNLSGIGFKILMDLFASSPEAAPLQGAALLLW